jgi:hypothetical protein
VIHVESYFGIQLGLCTSLCGIHISCSYHANDTSISPKAEEIEQRGVQVTPTFIEVVMIPGVIKLKTANS